VCLRVGPKMSCSFQSQSVHCVRQRLIGDLRVRRCMVGWMESANPFVCEGRWRLCLEGRELCQRVQAGRSAPEGGHWPIGKQRLGEQKKARGHPGAICGRERGRSGPLDWFGIHRSLNRSSEELRKRIGKSRLEQESESESDSFLGASRKREDFDRA
jgi:hypothetical protein